MARDPDLDELLGAYAVHALDPDDAARLEAYVAVEPAARAELDRLRDAAAALGAGLEMDEDPPLLPWARLRAELFGDDPDAVVLPGSHVASGSGPAANESVIDLRPAAPVVMVDPAPPAVTSLSQRRWRGVALRALAAAGAVVAVVGLTVAAVDRRGAPSVADLASAAQEQPGSLQGTLTGAGGTARVVLGEDGRGYLVDAKLAPLESGRAYQLWSLDSAAPVSLGVLGAAPEAVAFTAAARPRKLAISVEPAQGSVAPSAAPVLIGDLT